MRQLMKILPFLPILAVLGLGACAAIPEDAWKPSSLDEMMGGPDVKVASFDST